MDKYTMNERIVKVKEMQTEGNITFGDRTFHHSIGDLQIDYNGRQWIIAKQIFEETYKFVDNQEYNDDTVWFLYKSVPITKIISEPSKVSFEISTLEGMQTVNINDRVVIGVHGESYPISNDYFLANYNKK